MYMSVKTVISQSNLKFRLEKTRDEPDKFNARLLDLKMPLQINETASFTYCCIPEVCNLYY